MRFIYSRASRTGFLLRVVFLFLCTVFFSSASFGSLITNDTTFWTEITYITLPDYFDDQQTGQNASDLVGDADHPVFYTQFDDAGTASDLTDGMLAFRIRLSEAKNYSKLTFDYNLFIGLDADLNGSIDLFVGVNNQPSGTGELAIWNPGTDFNISPSTISIESPPIQTWAETTINYDFALVTTGLDPYALSVDMDANGNTDVFLSFSFDFKEIVSALSTNGISIDQNSGLRYVVGTSTQDNSLNQDLNGIDGGLTSTLIWDELGGASDTFSASGVAIPEPAVITLLVAGGLTMLIGRRIGNYRF